MVEVGDLAPNFNLVSLNSEPVSLRDYRGRSLLLIFLRHTG